MFVISVKLKTSRLGFSCLLSRTGSHRPPGGRGEGGNKVKEKEKQRHQAKQDEKTKKTFEGSALHVGEHHLGRGLLSPGKRLSDSVQPDQPDRVHNRFVFLRRPDL